MANIFTPSFPANGPWYIDREDCIGDSLSYINANTNYLAGEIINVNSSVDTKIASLSSSADTKIASLSTSVANLINGIGQVWQNLTSSRATGVTYTNTTGRPITVLISNYRVASVGFTTFTVGGVIIARTRNVGDNTVGTTSTISFIVPDNTTYSVTNASIDTWAELR